MEKFESKLEKIKNELKIELKKDCIEFKPKTNYNTLLKILLGIVFIIISILIINPKFIQNNSDDNDNSDKKSTINMIRLFIVAIIFIIPYVYYIIYKTC